MNDVLSIPRRIFAGIPFENFSIDRLLTTYAARDPALSFNYVVTPNVDHVIRLHKRADDPCDPFALAYLHAMHRLCDSRIIALLARLSGTTLAVTPGSDLTVALFASVIKAGDRIAIVGGSAAILQGLRDRFPRVAFDQHIPPMDLRGNEAAMADAAAFIERSSARFVFLAVGSPQQEMLARLIQERGKSTGLGLCVGASIAFLVNAQSRAPVWMQRLGIEWLYRLVQDPRRLWRRYLVEGPQIFGIAFRYRDLLPTLRNVRIT